MKKKQTTRSAFFNPRVILGCLLCSIGAFLALVGFGAFSSVFAQPTKNDLSSTRSPATDDVVQDKAPLSPADKEGRFVYLIEFAEPGMLQRHGHSPGFDVNAPEAKANREQLIAQQATHLQAMANAIGRMPNVTHHFLVTHSGIATRLTPVEANMVRTVPGVVSIERERLYKADTYRSPAFIGANTIWDGSNVPGGVGTKGQGAVIALLDTGVDPTHPSYANDPACGHGVGGAPNKLITFLDCATTDENGLCNGPSPADTAGHGSHTASEAAGNTLGAGAIPPPIPPAPATQISGVAPCANIREYKVCPDTCPGAEIQAGMNSVLLHGDVSVMSFSISGGTSPWSDNDRRKLDLVGADILVAAAAGNTSATITNPVGQVNHRGPWVLTVAASTRDGGEFSGRLSASGPGTPPPDAVNILLTKGSASPLGSPLANHPMKHFTEQSTDFEGCTPGEDGAPADLTPFPAGFFTGTAALIRRGNCPFTKKITNAFAAGADLVMIYNNVPAAVSMDTTGQPDVPAYSMDQTPGDALAAFVNANPATATVNFELVPSPGDILADFSFRGPIAGTLRNLTKPDVTGPGVDIYAAVPGGYGLLSGTSMSTPHTAGAAALVRLIHPTWTASEVKSALMMVGFQTGFKENGNTAWDADDVGNGRIDLTKAGRAGLVMNETFDNYLAANPGTGGDPKTLNIPSVRNMECVPNCSWTRTVRNTLSTPTSWTAAGHNITPGFDVTVQPTTFNFNGGLSETQVLTITAAPTTLSVPIAFGEVVLSAGGGAAPDHHISVAINGPTPTPSPSPTPGDQTPTPPPTSSPTPTPVESVTPTATPVESVTPTATPNPVSQAVNLSTRLVVQGGDSVGIGGFIISGTDPVQVLIRGIGPSLADFGVPNPLANPALVLNGENGFVTVTNNDWRDNQEQQIMDTGLAPSSDLESAILATLPPGSYTAIIKGQDGGAGNALIEIYDLSLDAHSKLGNISTRASVATGDGIMIAGFILSNGVGADTLVIRGIGPSLTDFGVPNALSDPNLEVRDGDGAVVASNDNWEQGGQAAELQAFNLAPSNAAESALIATLPPASYTALLSGVGGATGVGLVEVYDNPAPGATPGPTQTPGVTPTPPVGPTATPVPPTPTPGVTVCTETFDGVTAPALPAGWVASNPVAGDGVMFVTTTTTSDTAPNNSFIPDQADISDKVLDRQMTINSTSPVLTFRNNFNTEFSDGVFWDGAVLEISSPNISGGDFLDVTDSHVGGSITSGGYTGEISGDASNPLAGRMAWSGNSGGYIDSVINLGPNLNGQTITVRFRMGTDEAEAAPGWHIDTLSVMGASCQ